MVGGCLSGHTDAVWGLAFHPQRQHLLSCAADSTVRLWSADARSPLLYTYAVEKGKTTLSLEEIIMGEMRSNTNVYSFALKDENSEAM